ncbi:charged multivesicular body protein 6-like isoform X1 [Tigriopus californicus]|uniref:charged multivesicular body protein 6-like isoform X1 n=1 Tax=Tigriopus californicus TaxID=6832 RepID=UPI0027DA97C5|nr:charged multivesicular body protein 6-like isoform X1 [Tigriopus californicus]|eukprot:TCALIF_07671-PA protein Name:"Similar to CHMP6 Charged multivesicular body protein 6 (Homo sapiens)" AED:0.15 eAED:0.15 QI:112/1/1/1/1/1/5/196/212
MGGIFGKDKKSSSSRITEQDQAILKLKKQRDQLKMYQKRIEGVLEKDRLMAKTLLTAGKRDRAKLLLRKKKYQEGLLTRTDGQLETLERLVQDLEFAQIEKQVIDGLRVGNDALKKANEMFSIEEIESIMDDSREAIAKQQEIDSLISGQLSSEDEDEVLAELEALGQEIQGPEPDLKLPEVPTEKLPEPAETGEKTKSSVKKKKAPVALES